MTAADQAQLGPSSVFAPRVYQRDAIADGARLQAWMWSRQTGKGFAVALKINSAILEACARGESQDWLLLSRSLSASRQLGRKVRAMGRAMTQAMRLVEPRIEVLDEKQFELVYPGESRVLVLSSNPDAAVGFTGNVVIDEIDVHKQAAELLANTLPVASTGAHQVIVTSTPRGRRVMHKIFGDSLKPGSQWSFRKLTIHEAIAQGCRQDAEFLRRGILDELKWRQEYLCEFVDDEICWIPWELLVNCTSDLASAGVRDGEGAAYFGWDVARWNHLSVLYCLRKSGHALTTCGVVIMRRMPFEQQLQTVQRTIAQFQRPVRMAMDAGGMGEMPHEYAARQLPIAVEPVKFTQQVKETLSGDLRRTMEERNLLVPDDDGVRDDFHAIRRSVTAAGNARFEGETEGSHADRYWAATLAVHAAIERNSGGMDLI